MSRSFKITCQLVLHLPIPMAGLLTKKTPDKLGCYEGEAPTLEATHKIAKVWLVGCRHVMLFSTLFSKLNSHSAIAAATTYTSCHIKLSGNSHPLCSRWYLMKFFHKYCQRSCIRRCTVTVRYSASVPEILWSIKSKFGTAFGSEVLHYKLRSGVERAFLPLSARKAVVIAVDQNH